MPVAEKSQVHQESSQNSAHIIAPTKRPSFPTARDYLSMDIRPQNQSKFALISRVVKYMKVQSTYLC